ncbi:MAG: hypothetical protein ACRDFC_00050 [Ignavibacteria bacterium]
MPESPWKSLSDVNPDRDYLALISYLPLKKFWSLPKFVNYTGKIQKQLRKSAGLIGYSLLAKPLKLKFWTLSVWEDEKALMDFVRDIPHKDVMSELLPHIEKTKFERWKIRGSEVPPAWKDALTRL